MISDFWGYHVVLSVWSLDMLMWLGLSAVPIDRLIADICYWSKYSTKMSILSRGNLYLIKSGEVSDFSDHHPPPFMHVEQWTVDFIVPEEAVGQAPNQIFAALLLLRRHADRDTDMGRVNPTESGRWVGFGYGLLLPASVSTSNYVVSSTRYGCCVFRRRTKWMMP